MAEGTVDNLNIQLSADADQAVKSLDNLASTLRSINTAFAKDISGMRSFSKEIGTLTYAMKELNNVKVSAPDLSKISKAIKGLGETKTSAAKSTANDVKDIVNSLKGIGNVNFNESGVTKLTNSLKRLVQVDMSAFDVTKFKEITDAVSTLGNMPDVSSGVNKFVSSLSRLANAGAKTGEAANDIRRLGEQTRLAVQELSSIGAINDDVNMFVQSIGRLASAGSKTSQTASGLSALSKETLDFFKTMQNAPKISQNTIAMTQALAQLASAGGRVGTATGQISSAFSRLSNLSSKAGSIVSAAGKKIVSTFKSIGDSGKHINKAGNFLTDFIKGAVLYQGVTGLIELAKSSIDLGSSITEVENVVDVSFGNMAQSAYDFASTAKEQFGLSELAAKQYSGTMMAMLKSSGVAQDAAAEMSTTLAGLAGDLASFYNIETDEAFYKLRAAISGEVEPLRQLGINMTVANMEAYALSQGITKSWQSMTQAEQAMLRYNYILSVTSDQQGDFARTANSYANQLRLLKLNFQTLSATIGQGFIAAILPAIQGLNALMSALQRVAEAFRTFMYTLTGYEPQGSQSGIVNDLAGLGDTSTGLENIGTSGEDAADGMDDASDAAEDLKDSLSVLSFDELNQLASAATSAGDALKDASSGAGGLDDINVPGTGSGISTDLGDLPLDTQPISAWAKRIRDAFLAEDWDRLGYEIANGLNRGLQKVYDVINWKNVGPKITAFTSAFTQTFNSLVDNIDFDLMGRTVGAGINTIVNSINQLADGIDWVNLGRRISDGFDGLFDEVDWYNLGHLIGNKFRIAWDIFGGFVQGLNFEQIGTSVAQGLNGVFSTISFGDIAGYLATALNGVFTSLASFAETFEWDDLVDNIVNGITTFIETFEWEENAERLNTFLTNLLGSLKRLAEEIPWEELGQKIGEFIGGIDWPTILYDAGTIIAEALGGVFDGLEASGFAGKVTSWIAKGLLLLKLFSPVIGVVKKIVKLLTGETAGGLLKNGFKSLFKGAIEKSTSSLGSLEKALEGASGKISGLGNTALMSAGFTGMLSEAIENSKKISENTQYGSLSLALNDLKEDGILTNEQFDKLNGTLYDAGFKGVEFKDAFVVIEDALEDAGVSVTNFETVFSEKLDDAGVSAEEKSKIIGQGIANGTTEGIEESKEKVREATEGLGTKIINWFKNLLGIHSPSTVFAEMGRNIVQGLINGILELAQNAIDSVSAIGEDIVNGITSGINPDNVKELFEEILNSIKNVIDDAPAFFKNTFDTAYTNVQNAWKSSGNWFSNKWKEIQNVFSPSVVNLFKDWFQKAYTGVQNIWKPVNSWFSNKWKEIQNVFSPSVINSFKDWFQKAYIGVQNIWQPVNSWFQRKWESVKSVFSPVADTFRTWFQNAYTNVQNIWSGVSSWFQGRWNDVQNVFSNVSGFFRDGFQSAYDSVKSIWYGLGDFFKGVAKNAFSPIKKLVNGVISGVNWVLEKVGSKTRLSSWSGVAFKKGSDGIPQDTLGVVNDQKGSTYRELIVPPNGKPFIPKGRNVMLPLQKGTKIMPANETKEFLNLSGIPKFEGGIGDFLGGAWNAIKDFTGQVWDYITHPGDLVKIAIDKFTDISGMFEPWLSVAGGMVNKVLGGITDFVSNIFDETMPTVKYNPSAGVEQWRSLAAQALRMEGQYSPSNLNLMLFQMQTESSGNPNAINLWDSNAKRGTPSKGLMQVIDPTFRAYARPGYNSNIWDPLSNMLASIRYTVRRYGSLARGWRGHGYAEGIGTITLSDLMGGIPFLAKGGLITSPTLAFTGENFRKEAVLPLENRRTMGMIADSIVSNSSGGLGLSKAEIQQAVAEGVVMAMMNNQGNQPNITVYAELKTENDEVLARAVTRGQQKIDYRMNPVGT